MTKILVCGSRVFTNPFVASLVIDERIQALPADCEVIDGGARGADQIAAAAAVRHGHTSTTYLADWHKYGKRAGILRNLAMLDQGPELVIAFYNGSSRGTFHTIAEARKRGIPVEVIPLA